jgi:2-polyprenyl-3-methyl-5-hydroxy-6-metoxy-1,4-benzoquinol methylase
VGKVFRETVFVHIRPDEVIGADGAITQRIADFIRTRLKALLGGPWVEVNGSDDQRVRNGVYVELTTKAPMIDEVLLAGMIGRAIECRAIIDSEGACPGTAPILVQHSDCHDRIDARRVLEISDRQVRHNCQLSLHKQKRLRIFLRFLDALQDLAEWPLERFLQHLATPQGTAFVIGYGAGLKLEHYEVCPNCESSAVTSVQCANGQPVIGFLTRQSAYYNRCGGCGLVFLNPAPRAADLHQLYDWYDLEFEVFQPEHLSRERLAAHNPYGEHHRHLFGYLDAARCGKKLRFLDIGGGTGRFSMSVRHRYPSSSVAVRDFRIGGRDYLQQHGIEASEGNILEADFEVGCFDVVTLWEVIEHFRFEDISRLLEKVSRWLAPNGILALSTPNIDSPLCRVIDFWAWFAPHHLTVLRPSILELLAEKFGFLLDAQFAESVMFAPGRSDFAYAAGAHAGLSARAEAAVLNELIGRCPGVKEYLRNNGHGSEMILVFGKHNKRSIA